MKIKSIIIGWGKHLGFFPTSAAEEKLSELRLRLCSSCPDARESKVLQIINGHAAYEHQLQCTRCGCPCLEKSLVISEYCPINKW